MTCQNTTSPVKIKDYPLISIVIPIYNVEQFLKEAIDSVCKQSYKNLEIILVNDGSTDNSGVICEKLADNDNRIKVIHKKNGGLSSARNVGIMNSIGDFIFFLDSDDFIEKTTIEILLEQFKLYKDIGIVSAPCFYSYDNGICNIYNNNWKIDTKRIIKHYDFCIATLTQSSCHSACCKLYKRELFDNIRFREGKKNEDTLFMFDLSFIMKEKQMDMLEIPNIFYYYRVNNGSISRNIYRPIQIDIIENLQDMKNETQDLTILDTLEEIYHKELISFHSQLITAIDNFKYVEQSDLKKIISYFNKVTISSAFKYTPKRFFIKYIFMKYAKLLYIVIFKFYKILYKGQIQS